MAEEEGMELDIENAMFKMEDLSKIVMPLNKFLENNDSQAQLRTINDVGLQDSASQKFIVDAYKMLATVYDQLKLEFKFDGLDRTMSETSCQYKDNYELEMHFSNWCTFKKKLIEIFNSTAEKLDQKWITVNIAGMISSFVEILNSLNLDLYIIYHAYNISSSLGLILESVLFNLKFIGIASAYLNICEYQVIIKRLVHAMTDEINSVVPVKEWFDETKELDELVNKLFPYKINKEITNFIENTLEDLKSEEKIFSIIVLSSLTGDSMSHKNRNFLVKVFFFCISDAARVWYKRLITEDHPIRLFCDEFDYHSQILQMEGTSSILEYEKWTSFESPKDTKQLYFGLWNIYADRASILELGKWIAYILGEDLRKSDFGRWGFCWLNFIIIYYYCKNLRTRSKHTLSDKLRIWSRTQQLHLFTVDNFRLKYL